MTDADEDTGTAALFDELSDGDISNNPANPLALPLTSGDNRVSASMVAPDLDYVAVTVPEGFELSGIALEEYTSANTVSFIGVQPGSTFTEPADNATVGNLLGYTHFGISDQGGNILTAIGLGAGAQGFTPPLAAGDYTFWIQETGSEEVDYTINLELSPVP